MDATESLSVREVMQKHIGSSVKTGAILMVAIPATLMGVSYLTERLTQNFPSWLMVLALLFLVGGIAFLLQGVVQILAATVFLRWHKVTRWRELGTPAEIMEAIENDWNRTPAARKFRAGSYYLTPNWLLYIGNMYFASYPLQYIAWAYYNATRNSVNGIPTGTAHTVVIHVINSWRPWKLSMPSEQEALELLAALHQQAPWASYGYSDAQVLGWKKQRDAFVATVRERYAQAQHPDDRPTSSASPLSSLDL